MLIGAIEAGGTKIICGIGDETGQIHEQVSFPTREPETTVPEITAFFANKPLAGIGIGSFGPVNVDRNQPGYGTITSTPKLPWQNFSWQDALAPVVSSPIFVDTDVNAAALGELRFGAAKGLNSCAYITVGTGIGIGLVVEQKRVHGLMHPEFGHMLVRRHPDDDFPGICPFHQDCLEGLASGSCARSALGRPGVTLDSDHIAWTFEADYLAQTVYNLILAASPQRVILGGGVMHQPQLLPCIRQKVQELLNGYVRKDEVIHHLDDYIVAPSLGDLAGLTGALALVLDEQH